MAVSRFGVSLEADLLEALDNYVKENHFPNRSQAIRNLIERNLVEKKWQCNHIVAGAIILLYDHHKHEIITKLIEVQHDFQECVLSSQHYHLSHTNCLEIIAVKGKANELTAMADKLIALKGIKHGKLLMSQVD